MNNPIITAICAFLMLLVLLTWVGYRLFYKPNKFLKQLGTPVIAEGRNQVIQEAEAEPQSSTIITLLQQLGSKVPSSEAESANLKKELVRAGFRGDQAPLVFYGIRILTTLAMLGVSLMMQANAHGNTGMQIALLLFGVMLGWKLPFMALERKVKSRQETIRLSLPDALDLMVVSVEAGLGLDQAIQHVARELLHAHKDLSDELQLVTLEMRAGKRRADALRNFSERTGEPEVRRLMAILIQNDRFGTSMAESLRNHSDFMRTRRRQDAEERAGKVGVKLVFPIFFFILPSMLIVSAGPGLLSIFKDLFPMMSRIGK
jgi:tight adherence protein C